MHVIQKSRDTKSHVIGKKLNELPTWLWDNLTKSDLTDQYDDMRNIAI